ncbi:hypothetical protein ACFW17_07410 [Streptomyces sp. NPDC058961]|uniref:hypothetical protein n=1 Tax=Streptomyces sp. NPDC058961 TaxID=3346680 RepID=UPI0036C688DE
MESCLVHYDFVAQCFDCCRRALSVCPGDIEDLTRRHPEAFAEFAKVERAWVEDVLLTACAGRSLTRRTTWGDPLVSWAAYATPAMADVLPVPSAVAVGLVRASQERGYSRMRPHPFLDRFEHHVDQRLAQLWRELGLLAEERDPVAAAGLRHSVEKQARPGLWARSLEWLLLLGPDLEGLDVALTVALADKHPVVRQAVNRSSRSKVLPVQLRAAGLRTATDTARPLAERLLDIVSASVDARRTGFPQPLSAPASTWLADHGLEGLVRGATRRAVAEFAVSISDLGAAEEEHLTATLLASLVREFTDLPAHTRLAGVAGPNLRVGHRTVTKKEERSNGADVGVVVDIRVPGRLLLRTGDLIQVKKSTALAPGRSDRADAWTIKRRQLHDLLDHSASAAYWLIRGSGDVLVIPAKFLAAAEGATARPASQQFTVSYTAIRHTAVPMEQYLPDLIVGLWLGSTSEHTLEAAQGTSRTTRPRFALSIDVVLEAEPMQG